MTVAPNLTLILLALLCTIATAYGDENQYEYGKVTSNRSTQIFNASSQRNLAAPLRSGLKAVIHIGPHKTGKP